MQRKGKTLAPATLVCLWFFTIATHALGQNGSFPHSLDLRMNRDGRTATLLSVFAYVDGSEKRWEVPAGTLVDGASIPQPLWAIVGSPWTGLYREASVIHDYFCETRRAPWETVHRNFYTAMLANGVGLIQAKIMYAAVYRFGPRWKFEYTPVCQNCASVPHRVDYFEPEFNQAEFEALENSAKSNAPVEALEAQAENYFSQSLKNKEIGTPIFIQ